jgi:hypothetical protein
MNENNTLTLRSPTEKPFTSVIFASYGTPTGTYPNFAIGSCHAANSQSIVKFYVIGQTTANIPATYAVFGDPCFGTSKYLIVVASTV